MGETKLFVGRFFGKALKVRMLGIWG